VDRVTFVTSRVMEFFSEKELVAQTGHEVEDWPLVAAAAVPALVRRWPGRLVAWVGVAAWFCRDGVSHVVRRHGQDRQVPLTAGRGIGHTTVGIPGGSLSPPFALRWVVAGSAPVGPYWPHRRSVS
jgi:hypothetical protein